MKQYEITIQGDRYPVRDIVDADSFIQALKKATEMLDKAKLSARTPMLTIRIEKIDNKNKND